jgi:MauM/NapG family ferredoxin protein
MADEKPLNRRSFFRDGVWEMLRPLSKPLERKIAPLERALEQFGAMPNTPSPAPPTPPRRSSLPVLRPPGALAEDKFLDACTRCGECVTACPAAAIQIDETAYNGSGAPYIDPEVMPCVVCNTLACMKVCPTDALGYVPRWLIHMGTAEWDENLCVRRYDTTCTTCIDQCPIGSEAIELRDGKIHVKETGCTGCGSCQYYCPTYPKSITVRPRDVKNQVG